MALRMNKNKARRAIETKSDDSRYSGDKEYWNYIYGMPYPKYKVIEGDNLIDIVPFLVTNENNPSVVSGESVIGDDDSSLEAYLDIAVHMKLGDKDLPVICTEFMGECPICTRKWSNFNGGAQELKTTNNDKYKKDFLGGYNASRRFVMYVIPRMGEQKGKLCWADFPLKGSGWGEKLLDRASFFERKNNELVDYVSCGKDGVKSIYFESETPKGQNWPDFKNFDFQDREVEVTEEMIRSVPDIMNFVVIPDDGEIQDYLGISEYDPSAFSVDPSKKGKIPSAYLEAKNGLKANDTEEYQEKEESKEEAPTLTKHKEAKEKPLLSKYEDDDDEDDDEEIKCIAEGREFGDYRTPDKCTEACPFRSLCRKEARMRGN